MYLRLSLPVWEDSGQLASQSQPPRSKTNPGSEMGNSCSFSIVIILRLSSDCSVGIAVFLVGIHQK